MSRQENLNFFTGKNFSIFTNQNLPRSQTDLTLNCYSAPLRIKTAPAKVNRLKLKSATIKNPKKVSPITPDTRLLNFPRPNVLHSYLSYAEILQYLDYLKVRYNDYVKLHTLGLSYERRPIKAIEIHWNCESNLWAQAKENRVRHPQNIAELDELEMCDPGTGRNIVFIEGGTHAREWITVTVALLCIHQLTEKNGRHRDLLRKLRFFIVPVVNPDGYEYSKNTNPRWRKNRRPHLDDGYIGTDCNRNFDFHWDQCKSISKLNTYQGDKPFSEPETKALATMLLKLAPKILLFLSLHSYAQCIMYPWGYTKISPRNAKLMECVALAARNAIKSYSGRYYRVGSISHITKRTIAGSVVDYAYGVVKTPLAFVMELPSHEYGFQPPIERISPLSNESWCGINEMCKHAYSLKPQIDQMERGLDNNKNEISQEDSDDDSDTDEATKKVKEVPTNVTTAAAALHSGNAVDVDKKIRPVFNVKKIEPSASGGYFTNLIDDA